MLTMQENICNIYVVEVYWYVYMSQAFGESRKNKEKKLRVYPTLIFFVFYRRDYLLYDIDQFTPPLHPPCDRTPPRHPLRRPVSSETLNANSQIEGQWKTRCHWLHRVLMFLTCGLFGGRSIRPTDFDQLARVMARIFHTEVCVCACVCHCILRLCLCVCIYVSVSAFAGVSWESWSACGCLWVRVRVCGNTGLFVVCVGAHVCAYRDGGGGGELSGVNGGVI